MAGATWRVRVRTTPGEQTRLTCQATRENPIPVHDIVSIRRVEAEPGG